MSEEGGAVADRRVHPATVALRVLKELPSTVLALPATLAVVSDIGIGRALGFAAFLAAVTIFFNWVAWLRFRYGVGAREIVIESGILSRNRRVIPFDRVQDVDIERALLQRVFGLAKVKVETGAGGKDEGVLDSVTLAEADRLRAAVRAWRSGHATPAEEGEGAGLAESAPEPRGRVLFAMDVKRVLGFGLFNFSLAFIAGIFALLQMFDDWLPFDAWDPARWVGVAESYVPDRFSLGALLAILALAVMLGVAAGIVRTMARDYGYTLSIEGDRFRRERGLFTRSEAVIARGRVQLAQVRTGPVRRALGWFSLSFQTLGAGTGGSGHQSAAPHARADELPPILAETEGLRLPPPPELVQVSRRHMVRALLHLAPPLALVLAVGLFVAPVLFALLAFPPLAASAMLERRFHRYALDDGLLFIAKGVWRQQLWIVPAARIQAMSLSRSFIQRRLGTATLAIDTAGAPVINAPSIVDVKLDLGERLKEAISAARRAASPHSSGRKSGTER